MEQISHMEVIDRKQNSIIMLECFKREEHLTLVSKAEDHVFEVQELEDVEPITDQSQIRK